MSDSARPEVIAFRELEQLVRHLEEEMAGFRRRALQAEARLRAIEGMSTDGTGVSAERAAALEQENAELRTRLARATERTRRMLDQVRFLRQQAEQGAE